MVNARAQKFVNFEQLGAGKEKADNHINITKLKRHWHPTNVLFGFHARDSEQSN